MKRGDDYDQIKDAIGHHMWEQVCELYPQLRDKVSIFCTARLRFQLTKSDK